MSLRILLVEDDLSNRMTLAALLEDEGFTVREAESCRTALEWITGATETYDVVLLDLHLGDGLGSELAPEVRRRHPSARVLALSGEDGPTHHWADARVIKGSDVSATIALMRELVVGPAGIDPSPARPA